jgi:hypothetical protein
MSPDTNLAASHSALSLGQRISKGHSGHTEPRIRLCAGAERGWLLVSCQDFLLHRTVPQRRFWLPLSVINHWGLWIRKGLFSPDDLHQRKRYIHIWISALLLTKDPKIIKNSLVHHQHPI